MAAQVSSARRFQHWLFQEPIAVFWRLRRGARVYLLAFWRSKIVVTDPAVQGAEGVPIERVG